MILSDEQLKALVVSAKLTNQKTLDDVVKFAGKQNVSLSEALVQKNVTTDDALGLIVANFLKVPFVNLSKTSISEDVFNLIPERVARRQKVIAFARDKDGLKVATSDPTNITIQKDAKSCTRMDRSDGMDRMDMPFASFVIFWRLLTSSGWLQWFVLH